jgi:hypothetical protein
LGAKEKFGSKGDDVTGGWKTHHNEEFRLSYFSSNIIKIIKSQNGLGMKQAWGGCAYKVFGRKLLGKEIIRNSQA